MNIGFTGTRSGMTDAQKKALSQILQEHLVIGQRCWFHHGDCIGADNEAHFVALLNRYHIAIHPPVDFRLRAFREGDILYPERDYITRNHEIVNCCDFLIAAPRGPEVLRSGTWATVRYARKVGKKVLILDKSGKIMI